MPPHVQSDKLLRRQSEQEKELEQLEFPLNDLEHI
jgi:hypothetical protein